MAEFVRVASVADLAPGKAREIKVNGKAIALCNVEGKFYALDNFCVHRGGPLGEGYVEGCTLECPWHGWRFNVETGMMGSNPGMKVETFPVKVEGDSVFVEI
jgi:nitrite reductase/ring-hydroxylating ferredoxin subunit